MTGSFVNTLANATADPGMGVVVVLGVGIVFAGLVFLVLILTLMNCIFSLIKPKTVSQTNAVPVAGGNTTDEKMDPETVAAVSAAIAETLGRDVSGIKITSIKKVN